MNKLTTVLAASVMLVASAANAAAEPAGKKQRAAELVIEEVALAVTYKLHCPRVQINWIQVQAKYDAVGLRVEDIEIGGRYWTSLVSHLEVDEQAIEGFNEKTICLMAVTSFGPQGPPSIRNLLIPKE